MIYSDAHIQQAKDQLANANTIRLSRQKVFRELKAGKRRLSNVLEHPDVQTGTIAQVVTAMNRWGDARMRQLLEHVGVSETRQVAMLTQRQKQVILEEVERGRSGTH